MGNTYLEAKKGSRDSGMRKPRVKERFRDGAMTPWMRAGYMRTGVEILRTQGKLRQGGGHL